MSYCWGQSGGRTVFLWKKFQRYTNMSVVFVFLGSFLNFIFFHDAIYIVTFLNEEYSMIFAKAYLCWG